MSFVRPCCGNVDSQRAVECLQTSSKQLFVLLVDSCSSAVREVRACSCRGNYAAVSLKQPASETIELVQASTLLLGSQGAAGTTALAAI